MLPIEEAFQRVMGRVEPLPPVDVAIDEAAGLVLAEPVTADGDSPPFDKALVDGFAVRSADGASPRTMIGEILAGQWPPGPVGPGEAIRIMTGAPMPPGADAVVMLEKAGRLDDDRVRIDEAPRPGQHRMIQGREYRSGEILLSAGSRLGAASIGVCASAGRLEVKAIPRPCLAIVTTGDEVVPPGTRPAPGQIRDSNGPMLRAVARSAGAEVRTGQPPARDEPGPLRASLRRALEPGPDAPDGADMLVISGGVSAGVRDLVPGILEELGIRPVFHKVRMKPGKPLWFGVGPDRGNRPPALVFGLPGNPVSGLVGMLAFVLPAVRVLAAVGMADAGLPCVPARLAGDFRHRGDRPTFHPASGVGSDTPGLWAAPIEWAGSPDLRAVTRADGFLWFPAGDRDWKAGEILPFLPIP
ncbi:MAG: gephyrin-like molybdotransferase Glp [Isosphaeraceae bacterium]